MKRLIVAVCVLCALLPGCVREHTDIPLTALSGRYGYAFEGPLGLQGTITKASPEDAEWVIEGSFLFPTGGYTLLAPEIVVAESMPEQIFLRLNVLTPSPNAVVTQALEERPFSHRVAASNEAAFTLTLTTIRPLV